MMTSASAPGGVKANVKAEPPIPPIPAAADRLETLLAEPYATLGDAVRADDCASRVDDDQRREALDAVRARHVQNHVLRRGALEEIDRRGLPPAAMARLAPEWASFPTWSGRSAYGQPVKSHQDLARFYSMNLNQLRRQIEA